MNPSRLEDLAAKLGAKRLTRTGRFVQETPALHVTLCSGGAIIATRDGSRVAAFHGGCPTGGVSERIRVVIVGGTAGPGDLRVVVKEAAAQRLAVGAAADVVDLRASSDGWPLGRFRRADGASVDWPEAGTSVIIDLNFLVALDRCLSGRQERSWLQIRDMMAWLDCCDTVPGFAIAECALGPRGVEGAERLQAALDVLRTCAKSEVSLAEAQRRFTERLATRSGAELPGADDAGHTYLNYLGALRAAELWGPLRGRPFRPNERVAAWRSWVDTMNQDGIGIPGYCRAAVYALLLGPAGRADTAASLLKLTRSPTKQQLLGVAWDLLYPTIADMAHAGELEDFGQRPVVILTADKPLLRTTESAALVGVVRSSAGSIGFIDVDASVSAKLAQSHLAELARIEHDIQLSQARRSSMQIDMALLRESIDAVEARLWPAGDTR